MILNEMANTKIYSTLGDTASRGPTNEKKFSDKFLIILWFVVVLSAFVWLVVLILSAL